MQAILPELNNNKNIKRAIQVIRISNCPLGLQESGTATMPVAQWTIWKPNQGD